MPQAINGIRLPVTTTGSAGSAAGDATSATISGVLLNVYLKFHASAPGATTDVTITEVGGAGRTLLTLTNTATSGNFPIRIPEVGVTGTALTGTTPFYLPGTAIKVAVAQCDALTEAVVAFFDILQ